MTCYQSATSLLSALDVSVSKGSAQQVFTDKETRGFHCMLPDGNASKLQATSLLSALNVSVSKVSALLAFVGKETSDSVLTGGGAIAVSAGFVGWQCRFSDGAHVNKFAHEFTGTGFKRQQRLDTVVMTTSSFSNFIGTAWDGAVDIGTVDLSASVLRVILRVHQTLTRTVKSPAATSPRSSMTRVKPDGTPELDSDGSFQRSEKRPSG